METKGIGMKSKPNISEINTHILYIRESIKEINEKLDRLPCSRHEKEITEARSLIDSINKERIRDLTIMGIVISVVVFVINFLTK